MADKPGYPVNGTFDRGFAQLRIKCPLNPAHGYIEPYEEAWLTHFVGVHGGQATPTAQPVLSLDTATGSKARETCKYKCRLPGCNAEFATSSQLANHLENEHLCVP